MEIYKFGGTSVGTAGRIVNVTDIISTDSKKIVVLSANGKSTDLLAEIIHQLGESKVEEAKSLLVRLKMYYLQLLNTLIGNTELRQEANTFLVELVDDIYSRFSMPLNQKSEDWFISRGELFSTVLFSLYLKERKIQHELVMATDIVKLDEQGRPDPGKIKSTLTKIIQNHPTTDLFVTQGFLCSDHQGNVATLGRGGSDFTASLLGAACAASSVQIWSDVDGFLNNDPGYVRGALPLTYLSFDEAAELAYFGARVLHPATLHPAKEAGIPVVLKNTLNPTSKGTVISSRQQNGQVKAVASKDNICSITIHSDRMLLAYGFLRKVFEVFENHQTSVDMVTTSEVSVSVTIDNTYRLENILADLSDLGLVEHHKNQSLVCVVGDSLSANKGNVEQVFAAVRNVPIRMISYGAAKNSIAFLVDGLDKINTLEALNSLLPQSTQNQNQYV
jgi:aspartate kinase